MTYVYQCPECDHTREVQRSIKDSSPELCHYCGTAMARVIQPVYVSFIGDWPDKERRSGK